MKNIFTTILAVSALACGANGQTILTGGFGTTGMGIVNGTTYTKTGTLGSGGYPFVSASKDGSRFYATSNANKLYFIDVASTSFVDSMSLTLRNLASSNEPTTLFALTNTSIVRINTSTKSITDSVVLGAPWLLEERPGAKEVWVTDSGKIHVIDYTSGLTVNTFSVAASPYDYAGVRFNPAGTMAFKAAGTSKKLFKIDAATKAVVTSINTFPVVPAACAVTGDGNKLFVNDATNQKVMIYNTSDLSLADSIILDKVPMNIYRHPTRPEMWVVHHFNDSVSVFNETTKALIASFNISGSPWYIAFGIGSSEVGNVNYTAARIEVYPNPASGNITVTGLTGNSRLHLYDMTGRQISNWFSNLSRDIFPVSGISAGCYLLHITDEHGKINANLPLVIR